MHHMYMCMYVCRCVSVTLYGQVGALLSRSPALAFLYSHCASSYALFVRSLMNLILSEAHRHKHRTQIKGAPFVC